MRASLSFVIYLVAASATLRAELVQAPTGKTTAVLTAEQTNFFEKQIRPVLVEKCYKCHSAEAEKVKGGLLVDTREGLRAGGDSGPAIVPGDASSSLLLKALRYTDKDLAMPPEKSGGKLSDEIIKDFEKWVQMGAPDPRDSSVKLVSKEIDWAKARTHWSFQVPRAEPLPEIKDSQWPRTEVDRFILAKLEARGLHPVADAEASALLRRLCLDLTGLPPSPGEIAAFLKECAAGRQQAAVEAVVDRLLAAPQFGERWARHWLDVARFGESTGKDRNYTFPTAWRYRNYVIAAVNADKPYDEFIREQIAGDLLPAKDSAEHNEHLIATSFLALGPKGLNEKNREQFAMDQVDDQIDTTSRAVLGLTVACARCHDHKFDPIPTRDYYALAGIFRSTGTYYGTPGGKNKNPSSLLSLEPTEAPSASAALPAVAPAVAAPVSPELGRVGKGGKKDKAERKARRRQQAMAAAAPAGPPGPAAGQTMGAQEGRIDNAAILVRGEVDHRGEKVPRGALTVLADISVKFDGTGSGRRELAEWLVSPKNPLTARVMVNRVWLHLFGQGLVRTADNFGTMGARPSHPELLDYLAARFVCEGWSLKKLIRELVLSRTYQLGSSHDGDAYAADPDNTLLWRASPRRLDAEVIRDCMLAASGQLDRAPFEGSVVAQVGDGYIGKGIQTTAFQVDSKKRSIYLPIVRDLVPDALEIFDFAEPGLVVAGRDATNVPAQALYLMNNGFSQNEARAMAQRVLATPLDYQGRLQLAYELTLSRAPTTAERERADRYLRTEGRQFIPVKGGKIPEAAEAAWATFCQALFACAEFRYLQ